MSLRARRKRENALKKQLGDLAQTTADQANQPYYDLLGQTSPQERQQLTSESQTAGAQSVFGTDNRHVVSHDGRSTTWAYRKPDGSIGFRTDMGQNGGSYEVPIKGSLVSLANDLKSQTDAAIQTETTNRTNALQATKHSELPTYDELNAAVPNQTTAEQAIQSLDPAAVAAQRRALGQMQDVATQGWTQTDRDALNAAQAQSNQNASANRQALMQQMAARGQRNGGVALMGALATNQGAANQGAQTAAQLGIEGRQRALQAMQSSYGMASNFNDQAQNRMSQMDAFNQYNRQAGVNARQNVLQNKVGAINAMTGRNMQVADFKQQGANNITAQQNQRLGTGLNVGTQLLGTALSSFA